MNLGPKVVVVLGDNPIIRTHPEGTIAPRFANTRKVIWNLTASVAGGCGQTYLERRTSTWIARTGARSPLAPSQVPLLCTIEPVGARTVRS